ncbi:glycosyltransferase [Flavobacterium sp.]|uniref:glycosyltransferase family 2 protein n=1 Tax=Flavobacterium sp. TaxID=239 RepID=UPI0026196E0F|nr:glycosyltransferase [Flavobacterium sp.]
MLSILIPTYNYNCFSLVEELKNQADHLRIEYEIIVQDDCSTEFVEENSKINSFVHCCLQTNISNLGRTRTRQILSEKARFDWVLLLDSDVYPTTKNFLSNYISHINNSNSVVIGGIKYEDIEVPISKSLRYKYGKEREEINLKKRNQKPYNYILSANILIKKTIFEKFNYTENNNLYGLDIYFAYQLFLNKIPILHIENEVYHRGIEDNEAFFKKSLSAVETRKKILENEVNIGKVNSLLKHYLFLKKYKLVMIVKLLFRVFESLLKKLIFSKNPSLMSLDLYRLGYLCTLKN